MTFGRRSGHERESQGRKTKLTENNAEAPAIEARRPEPHLQGRHRGRARRRPRRALRARSSAFSGRTEPASRPRCRMLCTLLPPTGGSASVAGHDVVDDGDEVRRSIGVALQEIGLDPVQTGRELLELQCGLYGITGAPAVSAPPSCSSWSGLTDAAERRTKTYSGGMKRRLDLASALVHQPEGALPRRADDRPRPRLAADRLGGGPQHQRDAAPRSSSPPSTWRRPTSSASGWRSSMPARSSPRGRPRA